MASATTEKAGAERAGGADTGSRRGPLGRPLRLRPLAFTAFAMITVVGAVALAFYLINVGAEDVFMGRERRSIRAVRPLMPSSSKASVRICRSASAESRSRPMNTSSAPTLIR